MRTGLGETERPAHKRCAKAHDARTTLLRGRMFPSFLERGSLLPLFRGKNCDCGTIALREPKSAYCTAMVTALERTPLMVSTTEMSLPMGAFGGTCTFT